MPSRSRTAVWDASRLEAPHEQADKSLRVRHMFDAIAPTYERVNAVASGGRDSYWRKAMVRATDVRSDDVLLDVACGTGDVARTFAAAPVRPKRIVGLDFSGAMLDLAVSRPIHGGSFAQADALRLPLADASVSIVTCAFGIRNFQDLEAGLREMRRVLRPGGRAVLLEFCLPSLPWLRRLYLLYFARVMPVLAGWISGDRTGAYRYLPRSVISFPSGESIVACCRQAGFAEVTTMRLTLGIVVIYVARAGAA